MSGNDAVAVSERRITPAANPSYSLKEQYYWEASAQWKGKPLEGDAEIDIALYFGTKRKTDWDNFHKLSMDALTGIVCMTTARW